MTGPGSDVRTSERAGGGGRRIKEWVEKDKNVNKTIGKPQKTKKTKSSTMKMFQNHWKTPKNQKNQDLEGNAAQTNRTKTPPEVARAAFPSKSWFFWFFGVFQWFWSTFIVELFVFLVFLGFPMVSIDFWSFAWRANS